MLASFDSRYEVPSRNYFSKMAIPSLYASVVEQLKVELSKVQYFLSFMVKHWLVSLHKLYSAHHR